MVAIDWVTLMSTVFLRAGILVAEIEVLVESRVRLKFLLISIGLKLIVTSDFIKKYGIKSKSGDRAKGKSSQGLKFRLGRENLGKEKEGSLTFSFGG